MIARALFFSEKLRADFVFDTAALEGNPFTFPEVKTLIEGVTVGGRKQSDAEQVSNINDALSWVIDRVRADALVLDRECYVGSMRSLHAMRLLRGARLERAASRLRAQRIRPHKQPICHPSFQWARRIF